MMDEDEKVLNMEAEAKEKAELKAIAEAKSEKDEVAKNVAVVVKNVYAIRRLNLS